MAMEIDAPTPEALFRAAAAGDAPVFRSLSDERLQWARSLRNDDDRLLLHVAAALGRAEVVDLLSAAEPSMSGVNGADDEGWTPLHSAVSSGHVVVVEMLLSRGASVNVKNDGGQTPLHYAASKGRLKIAEILLAHGSQINLKDKVCVPQSFIDYVLDRHGAQLPITSNVLLHFGKKVGCTPLHRAASIGNAELCELLIEEGAEIDAVDRTGQTPLMVAVICENRQAALLLIRHGADVDVEDKEGYTTLGRASYNFRLVLIDAAKAAME